MLSLGRDPSGGDWFLVELLCIYLSIDSISFRKSLEVAYDTTTYRLLVHLEASKMKVTWFIPLWSWLSKPAGFSQLHSLPHWSHKKTLSFMETCNSDYIPEFPRSIGLFFSVKSLKFNEAFTEIVITSWWLCIAPQCFFLVVFHCDNCNDRSQLEKVCFRYPCWGAIIVGGFRNRMGGSLINTPASVLLHCTGFIRSRIGVASILAVCSPIRTMDSPIYPSTVPFNSFPEVALVDWPLAVQPARSITKSNQLC